MYLPKEIKFMRQYTATALWCSYDDKEEALDQNYSHKDLAIETHKKMYQDCIDFIRQNEHHFGDTDLETIAHDFWLTRNHHGAGFWDGDYPEPEATCLTEAAHRFGTCDLYIGDDGKLYIYGGNLPF